MLALQTKTENQAEQIHLPDANSVEVHMQPSLHADAEVGLGITALAQLEIPTEVQELVIEDVSPKDHVRTSLVDRFKNRLIKRRMGEIEKELNQEHMELAEKQKVRPSVLQKQYLEPQVITSNPSDLSQRASILRREVFTEEPDQFDQKLAQANKMLARPQVSGVKRGAAQGRGLKRSRTF